MRQTTIESERPTDSLFSVAEPETFAFDASQPEFAAMTTFEHDNRKFTARADNGTRLVLFTNVPRGRIIDGYVIAHGFGHSSLYNCVNRNVGDLRRLFHKLAKADYVTAAYAKQGNVG